MDDLFKKQEEDKVIKYFIEEYPDIYGAVQKMIDNKDDDDEVVLFEEDYPDIYDPIRRITEGKEEDESIKYLKNDFPDIYEAVLILVKRKKNGLGPKEKVAHSQMTLFEIARQRFHPDLKREVPDWEEINKDPKFAEWLQQRDKDTGRRKWDLLKEAYDKFDAVRAASIFKEYLSFIKEKESDIKKSQGIAYKKGDFIGQKYEVYDVLGMGGFGIVYLVYSHETKEVYALKTFRDEYLEDIQTRERFKKEAQVWIDLERHPYMVRAYFVDEISGRLFIAMEYIAPNEEGLNSLDSYLRRRPPDLAQSLRWAIQFCRGMEYAYSRGIRAHRDIKPENIMIGQDKAVKISDFGLAGVIGAYKTTSGVKLDVQRGRVGFSCQTMEGAGFGTPTHMPPEQFTNAVGCDEKSDVYSFGIVLYQMVSGGDLPFLAILPKNNLEDESRRFWWDMYKLQSQAPVPRINSPLSTVIQQCLEKNSSKRYQSFRDLHSDLELLLKRHTGEIIKPPEPKEFEPSEWIAKGVSFYRLGRCDQAIQCFEKALEIDSNMAIAWDNKGLALDRLGKFDEAIECCNIALRVDPQCSFAWNTKGNCLEHQGHHVEAIRCYDKALEIDPLYVEPWYNKGISLGHLGNCDERAVQCYDKALEIDPSYASAWTNKGATLLHLGRVNEAMSCFDKALEINPASVYSWINKGDGLARCKRFDEVIYCYDKALEIDTNYLLAWHKKGYTLALLGRFDEAMHCYNKALEINPHEIDVLHMKALCFGAMGRLNDALLFIKTALRVVPNEASFLFDKAIIEDNLGNKQDAISSFHQFLSVAPAELSIQIEIARGRLHFLQGE